MSPVSFTCQHERFPDGNGINITVDTEDVEVIVQKKGSEYSYMRCVRVCPVTGDPDVAPINGAQADLLLAAGCLYNVIDLDSDEGFTISPVTEFEIQQFSRKLDLPDHVIDEYTQAELGK